MEQWTKEEESFFNDLNNIQEDRGYYRSKKPFLDDQSLTDDDDDNDDEKDAHESKPENHKSRRVQLLDA